MFASLICSHTFDGCKLRNTTALDWREEGHFMLDPCCWYVAQRNWNLFCARESKIRRLNSSHISWPSETALDRFFFAFGILLEKGNWSLPHLAHCFKPSFNSYSMLSWSNIGLIANIMIFSATLWVYWVRPPLIHMKTWWQCTQSADTACRWWDPATTWGAPSVGGSSSHWPQLGMASWTCFDQQSANNNNNETVTSGMCWPNQKRKQEKIGPTKLSAIAMRLPLVTLAILPAYTLNAQHSRHRWANT